MLVCAHGDVTEFCKAHDMVILNHYEGDIELYQGPCRVLVTDQELSEYEYYYLKGKMFAAGIELVSTRYVDRKDMAEVVKYALHKERTQKYGGRRKFGFQKDGSLSDSGRAVVKRIFELSDAGYTYRGIREDEGVYHPDGRDISISTIQTILKNREVYEKEGL